MLEVSDEGIFSVKKPRPLVGVLHSVYYKQVIGVHRFETIARPSFGKGIFLFTWNAAFCYFLVVAGLVSNMHHIG